MTHFAGIYINLDRSVDRCQRLEAAIARLGLHSYQRLPASDGAICGPLAPLRPGEHGCYLSHLRALKLASAGGTLTHIIEDDAILSPRLPAVIAAARQGGLFDKFDIVFLDISIPFGLRIWRHYRQAIRPGELSILNISRANFWSTTSYVVSSVGAQKVHDVCASALRTNPRAVDVVIREEANAGNLSVGALLPFPTTIDLGDAYRSTITDRQRDSDFFGLAMNLLRYSLAMDADMTGYARPYIDALRRFVAGGPDRPPGPLIRELLEFVEGEGAR